MTGSIQGLGRALGVAFVVVALALGYWSVIRHDELLARDDNPRLVLAERRIRRGQILDRRGEVLAETRIDPLSGLGARVYPYPGVAPVIGYYSLRYGVGGVEATYDEVLRGEAFSSPWERQIDALLHIPPMGGDVLLTLDLDVQQAANEALDGRKGAIVVLGAKQGEILAMSSSPSYDPNVLDDVWERLSDDPDAPLVNRATQGLYQPGSILQSVLLGSMLNVDSGVTGVAWRSGLSAAVDGGRLPCAGQPGQGQIGDIESAYLWACPLPFQVLAERIGAAPVDAALADFGLLEAPLFALPAEAPDLEVPPARDSLALTAIGQGSLTVSPLQMAMVSAAYANRGEMPALRLVYATRQAGGEWEPTETRGYARGTISRESADAVVALMGDCVAEGSAQAAAIPRQRVYGHVGLALSGPEHALLAWFIGFTYRADGEGIAVTVLLENTSDASLAASVGGQVLQAALASPMGEWP